MAQPGYILHLEELRKRIISVLAAFLLISIACFYFINPVMNFLQAPVAGLNVKLSYFTPYEKFMTYMKVAIFSGVFFAIPFMLFQLGGFIYPALKEREKPWFFIFIAMVPLLLFAGFAFGYFVMVPVAFRFFFNFASGDNVQAVWGISSYFDLITSMIFWSGVIFQLPLALVFLMKIRVLKPETLEKFRKIIIVLIVIIAGVFTPPDVITQVLMAVPMYLLFELSILAGKVINKA
jgi:sec-independent protein translocase protein TatC